MAGLSSASYARSILPDPVAGDGYLEIAGWPAIATDIAEYQGERPLSGDAARRDPLAIRIEGRLRLLARF